MAFCQPTTDPERSPSQASLVSSTNSLPIEKQQVDVPFHVTEALHARGFRADEYGVVQWLENSVAHPRRWSLKRKAYDSALICFLEFFMTMVSNTGSSVAMEAATDFDLGRTSAIAAFTTVYLIGQAFGGLILPPICESFGGRTIYVSSTFAFAAFCAVIGAWPTKLPVVIVGRLLTGALSAMPAVVAAGSIENMWDMRARIFLIHVWISSAVLGLACGPPIATYLSLSSYGWPWIFKGAACIAALSGALCCFMQESRPSQVLRHHVKSVAQETSFDCLSVDDTDSNPDIKTFMRTTLVNPTRLFFKEPIVFLTSVMAATVYGVTYLFSEAFTVVYTQGFGFSDRQTSLVFFAIAAGVAFTFLPRIHDVYITNVRKKQNRPIEPEDKLTGFYIAAPTLAAGLWWFAFTVPPLSQGISPWASITSLLLFGFAVVEFDNVLSGYLTDVYGAYAASANAPMSFLRAILSGTLPLCGTQMFTNLGANKALFILASVATAYCGVAVLFKLYGKRIRENSPFACKTWAASQSTQASFSSSEVEVEKPEKCLARDN